MEESTGEILNKSNSSEINMEDPELEMIKRRLRQAEEEAAKLNEMQAQVEREMSSSGADFANTAEADARSIYVGNVDYASTPEELQTHFQSCGTINRITILSDKWTGNPKGFAYVEFSDPSHVNNAMALNESLFRNRLLKVTPKRQNIPGYHHQTGRGGRGRGRGRGGRGRGEFRGRGSSFGSGSRRGYYAPY